MSAFSSDISTLWIVHSPLPYGVFTTNPHTHDFFQLMYPMEGKLATTYDDSSIILEEGMMSIIPPGKTHSITEVIKSTSLFEVKFFVWNPELSSALSKLPTGFKVDEDTKSLISLLMTDIYKSGYFSETTINSGINYLLNRIIESYLKVYTHDNSISHFSPYGKTDKMVEYIENNFAKNITLDAIAEYAGYSRNYASTIFRENHGITISKYINRIRIQKSCELIAYSDMSVIDICEMCGFSDIHNFGRAFKSHMGISPGKYRRAHRISDIQLLQSGEAQQPIDSKYFTLAVAAQKLIHWPTLLSFIEHDSKDTPDDHKLED